MGNKAQKNKGSRRRVNSKNFRKSVGPVHSLEEYVQSDWWRRIFDSIYLKTDGDVIDDEEITKKEVDLFSEILGLSPDEKILDLCCGQGRHSLELARRGYKNIEGLDRSHYLIQKAKKEAKKEGLDIRFREGDARKLPYPADTFDAVMILGNSFGYFETITDDLMVLKEVFRVLKPWGLLLIDVADGEYLRSNFQPRSWEWIGKKHFVCRERSLSLDGQRLISREVVTDVGKGVLVDQFYAERLYTKENLNEVLKKAGFSDINFHGSVSPESKRNQDLGMMGERIIATTVAKKKWTEIRKKKEMNKKVTVIFGDPKKPDPAKPSGIFDEDDFYTIDRLKDALREIKGYEFRYLDNHDTLVGDIMKIKSKTDLVLNLCDEGFMNDPKKELHVPALLEMLDIPYTGSPPQCLSTCYDKSLVKGIAREMDIPVPEAFIIKPGDSIFDLSINFPVIVKPNSGDASIGITQKSVAYNIEELVRAISDIRGILGDGQILLVEEFLTGSDLSLGIIGNPPEDYIVLPLIEEDYSSLPPELPRICGYEAKWFPDSPYWKNLKSIPAELPEKTQKEIADFSLQLFERLGCRDYCRFDWRLDSKGKPRLLEANPNPGWCWDGHLAKMAGIAGISYPQMLEAILKAAEKRLRKQYMDTVL